MPVIISLIEARESLGGAENVHTTNSCRHDLGHLLKVNPTQVLERLCLLVGITE
jgi:hypothetical protein